MICDNCKYYDLHNQHCKYPILYEDIRFKEYKIVDCIYFKDEI